MDFIKGYILTRERVESGGRHNLRYTGIGDQGPFEIIITFNQPLFFIHRTTDLPKRFFDSERRAVDLTDFNGNPVDALYFKTQRLLFNAREKLQEKGIKTFEADIHPEERFLMERFIYGSIEFQGPGRQKGGLLQFIDPQIRKGEYRPLFTVLSLDIETGQNGELYSIACHFTGRPPSYSASPGTDDLDSGMVLMLDENAAAPPDSRHSDVTAMPPGSSETDDTLSRILPHTPCEALPGSGLLFRLPGEADLLKAFLDVVNFFDPDILIGWHVVGFDLLFLSRKYNQHKVPFLIGRGRRLPQIREIRKSVFRADISGRIVIDGPPALRAAFYSFDNFKLETVATELLGTGKDIGENQDKVAEIERRFKEDKPALAHYNLMDCRLVSDIFDKTGLADLTFKRAALSGLSMDRIGMSVAAFDYFMLPHIHRKGLVAPNVKDVTATGGAPGGWVFVKAHHTRHKLVSFFYVSRRRGARSF